MGVDNRHHGVQSMIPSPVFSLLPSPMPSLPARRKHATARETATAQMAPQLARHLRTAAACGSLEVCGADTSSTVRGKPNSNASSV
jgi:hypothetical protein